ncbi:hypothetical protein N9L68_05480 [bacterium]|nr:hypothetical protein [bacterium]
MGGFRFLRARLGGCLAEGVVATHREVWRAASDVFSDFDKVLPSLKELKE